MRLKDAKAGQLLRDKDGDEWMRLPRGVICVLERGDDEESAVQAPECDVDDIDERCGPFTLVRPESAPGTYGNSSRPERREGDAMTPEVLLEQWRVKRPEMTKTQADIGDVWIGWALGCGQPPRAKDVADVLSEYGGLRYRPGTVSSHVASIRKRGMRLPTRLGRPRAELAA